jgi:hypothetical protein
LFFPLGIAQVSPNPTLQIIRVYAHILKLINGLVVCAVHMAGLKKNWKPKSNYYTLERSTGIALRVGFSIQASGLPI